MTLRQQMILRLLLFSLIDDFCFLRFVCFKLLFVSSYLSLVYIICFLYSLIHKKINLLSAGVSKICFEPVVSVVLAERGEKKKRKCGKGLIVSMRCRR